MRTLLACSLLCLAIDVTAQPGLFDDEQKIAAQGKWQLDAPLAKYWVDPDVAADPRHRIPPALFHEMTKDQLLLPKSNQGLVVMTNADNGYRLYDKLVTELLDAGTELMSRAGQ